MSSSSEQAAGSSLPDINTALRLLRRRRAAVFAALFVRLISSAVLSALLMHYLPAASGLVQVFLILLIVCPLYTGLGRLYAWRIALGRAFLERGRALDAAHILAPLDHPRRALLFDASGEGRRLFASAVEASRSKGATR